MAVSPKSRKQLDTALEYLQGATKDLTKKVKDFVHRIDTTDYNLLDFARATKLIADALKILTELAPFFEAKKHIEGTEGLILWLSMSSDVIGEERQRIIEVVKDYQLAILKDADTTGLLEREQYQLL